MISRALAFMIRHATLVLVAGIVAGLLVPPLAALLRPLLGVAIWGMLFLAMVRVDWTRGSARLGHPWAIAGSVVWMLAVTPIGAWLVTDAFGLPAGLAAGVVLFAASPPMITTPALALLLGLDSMLALVLMGAATVLAPLAIPVVAVRLLGLDVGLDGWTILLRLVLFVGSCIAAAAAARRVLGPRRLVDGRPAIDGTVVLLLFLYAVGIMDGVARRLLADPEHVLGVIALAFAVSIVLQAAGAAAFAWRPRLFMLTVGFASGNRNLALTIAVLPADAPADIFLFFVCVQLPIYLLPVVLKSIYASALSGEARDTG